VRPCIPGFRPRLLRVPRRSAGHRTGRVHGRATRAPSSPTWKTTRFPGASGPGSAGYGRRGEGVSAPGRPVIVLVDLVSGSVPAPLPRDHGLQRHGLHRQHGYEAGRSFPWRVRTNVAKKGSSISSSGADGRPAGPCRLLHAQVVVLDDPPERPGAYGPGPELRGAGTARPGPEGIPEGRSRTGRLGHPPFNLGNIAHPGGDLAAAESHFRKAPAWRPTIP
jgi:hypothetical protein